MEHILSLSGNDLQTLYDVIFPKIANRQTILFLGAGASVTDRNKFLSKEIMELYSAKARIQLDTNDIIDFVDALSSNTDFSRNDFDQFVDDLLSKLKVTDTHKIIASLPWKEIITTNFDLLIEKAFDEIIGTPDQNLKRYVVRKPSDYYHTPDNDEVKYVKLNGDLSDKKQYPLVFSTKDFERVAGFYKTVLRTMESLSPRIQFLSVGYSYSDEFSKALSKRFDVYNYRSRRWMLSVDPFVEDARLPYFTDRRICIIRTTAENFFNEYKRWEAATAANIANRKRINFTNKDNYRIDVPNSVALRIADDLVQISDTSPTTSITPENFYKGEQPTFDVIKKNLDVIKQQQLRKVTAKINEILAPLPTIVPVLFLSGSYGTGKTTFCYRTINELIHDETFDALGFEVIDAGKLKPVDLEVLFSNAKSKNIILFFNGIEVDSAFKSLIDFRARISSEQFQNFKVLILASIRENILNKYLDRHTYINTHELNIDTPFTEEEAKDLVEKLGSAGLVHFRDARERNQIINKVINEFSGDTLVSLISLVSESSHDQIVRDAYLQLTPLAQKAFLYTSLLYRFNIQMPAGLLRALLGKTWEELTREVLQYDSKGILIQEEINSPGTNPDIYLRTKHPIISNSLVGLQLASEDARYEKYLELVRHLNPSAHSSSMVVDLLKAIRDTEDLSEGKINKLFDACSQIFDVDPRFNLHYAINLQYRNSEDMLHKGIERLQRAEAASDRRSHYLIHRRAVLNFRLAQMVADRELPTLNETLKYVQQARNLFDIKLILDPFSSYSYIEYLRFEIWCLENIRLSDVDRISQRIKIEDLLDRAEKSVIENTHVITQIKSDYLIKTAGRTEQEKQEYLDFLDDAIQDPVKRPYALILKFYYYERLKDIDKCEAIIADLESHTHLDEVGRVLFRYYGKRLNNLDNRIKFFDIVIKHPKLEKTDTVLFHYYSFVAEAYNRNFKFAYEHVTALRGRVNYLSPALREFWREENSPDEKIFKGIVVISKGRKRIQVIDLQHMFDLITGDYSTFHESSHQDVVLHFYLNGIKAEIIELIYDETADRVV
jgi:hypothetical protein